VAESTELHRFLCLSVDVVGYGTRPACTQMALQVDLLDLLNRAGEVVGLHRELWIREQRGDEELALVPAGEPEATVVDAFFRELSGRLFARNHRRPAAERLRLRAAVTHGMVSLSSSGFGGLPVVEVKRLVDSFPLRQAVAACTADLVVLLSGQVHRDIVAAGYTTLPTAELRRMQVQEKEHRDEAWLWIPGVDATTLTLADEQSLGHSPAEPVPGAVIGTGNVTGSVIGNGNAVGSRNRVGR
jgi:hypothetical protein